MMNQNLDSGPAAVPHTHTPRHLNSTSPNGAPSPPTRNVLSRPPVAQPPNKPPPRAPSSNQLTATPLKNSASPPNNTQTAGGPPQVVRAQPRPVPPQTQTQTQAQTQTPQSQPPSQPPQPVPRQKPPPTIPQRALPTQPPQAQQQLQQPQQQQQPPQPQQPTSKFSVQQRPPQQSPPNKQPAQNLSSPPNKQPAQNLQSPPKQPAQNLQSPPKHFTQPPANKTLPLTSPRNQLSQSPSPPKHFTLPSPRPSNIAQQSPPKHFTQPLPSSRQPPVPANQQSQPQPQPQPQHPQQAQQQPPQQAQQQPPQQSPPRQFAPQAPTRAQSPRAVTTQPPVPARRPLSPPQPNQQSQQTQGQPQQSPPKITPGLLKQPTHIPKSSPLSHSQPNLPQYTPSPPTTNLNSTQPIPITRVPTSASPQPPRAQPPTQRPPSRSLSQMPIQTGQSLQTSPVLPHVPPRPVTASNSPQGNSPSSNSPQAQPTRAQPLRIQPTQPPPPGLASKPTSPPRKLGSSAPLLTQNNVGHQSSPNFTRAPPPISPRNGMNGTHPNGNGTSGALLRSKSEMTNSPRPDVPRRGPPVSPRGAATIRGPLIDSLTEQDHAAIIRVQAFIRMWLLKRKFKKRVKDNIHRTKVVRELLSSEETYVMGLNVINQTYLEQLTWNAKVSPNPFLGTDQINTIFSTVAGIATFNQTLLEKLRERVNDWGPTQMIGDVFLTMAPFLRLYTTYCTNYDLALQTLQKAKQTANFAAFLETCMKSTAHTLESLLITVVQRVPRYILLLQDFIKHTWPEHCDYTNLTNALKLILEKLNKGIGEAEALNKVIALQGVIVGVDTLVTPSRMYVREGPICECTLEAKSGKEIEKLCYFLFNDCLIITDRKKDDKYQLKHMVDFTADASMKFKDVPDNLVVQNAFQIVSPTITLFLTCQDSLTKLAILDQTKQFKEQVSHRLKLTKAKSLEDQPEYKKPEGAKEIGSELTVTIPRTERCKDGKKEYTVYHTKIRDDKTKKGTIISKRYSEFDSLHKALKKAFPDTDFMDLPKKHLVGSLSKETVESRRVMLEMYLQALVQKPEIRNSPIFLAFISGYAAPPSANKKSRKISVSSEI